MRDILPRDWAIRKMESLLNQEAADALRRIYAPVVTAAPPEDARRCVCILPDGEIRMYGQEGKPAPFTQGRQVYLSSRDCGLSWTTHRTQQGDIGPSYRSPFSGRYVDVRQGYEGYPGRAYGERSGELHFLWADETPRGVYAYTSQGGPGKSDCVRRRILKDELGDAEPECYVQPCALRGAHRLIASAQVVTKEGDYHPLILLSDDDGDTWQARLLPSTPRHEAVYPHRRQRWQNNGSEPVWAELSGGTIMVLARTSLDIFYVYYSYDHGDTFTSGEPSPFHGTLTSPSFLTLCDGRTLLFYCNTQPLPEIDVSEMLPAFDEREREILEKGRSEDVFTNRDVVHVAVTIDGINWKGLRELYLNPLRDRPDFRTLGDPASSLDRSVHQSQAIELPFGKVLVTVGQHEAVRRALIFDADWVCEKERREDFSAGLAGVTTHVYVKSYSGCAFYSGLTGHCQYNRTSGALLVPVGRERFRESLCIGRSQDERLLSDKQGVTWNFPACEKGECEIELCIRGAGVRVSLLDRWVNASDDTAYADAAFTFDLKKSDLPKWSDRETFAIVQIAYDCEGAVVRCGEKTLFMLQRRNAAPLGVSYLHLITLAERCDWAGTLVASMVNRAVD